MKKVLLNGIKKNNDAVAYIKLSISDEQAIQFATKENVKVLWVKNKINFYQGFLRNAKNLD